MAHPVLMPKQGITVESCVITKWHKKPGDMVQKGETLYSYETDKATFDVEAEQDGALLAVFFPEGEDIPVLTAVAAIGEPGEDVSALDPRNARREDSAASVPVEAPKPEPTIVPSTPTAPATPSQPVVPTLTTYPAPSSGEGEPRISPRARALAASVGLIPNRLTGTGPDGRIIERDVRAQMAAGPVDPPPVDIAARREEIRQRLMESEPPFEPPTGDINLSIPHPDYRKVRLSGVRRAIARSMTQSLTSMAQLTLSTSFDATAMLDMRKAFKASSDPEIQGITLTDMVLYAVVHTLVEEEHWHFNAHLVEDVLHLYKKVHLAFAVDTPRGLLVPVIRSANRLSLRQLSLKAKSLAAEAQQGSISPDLLSGGTFTVSNLGGLGIEHFTPVINPPQTGILGVNNITYRPRDEEGSSFYPAIGLSITFDHRAVDGAPAARFVRAIGQWLENIQALLAG